MRKLIYLFIIGQFIITSCKENSIKNNEAETSTKTEDLIVQESKVNEIDSQTSQIIKKDSLDISFIGKTTQELDNYNFHNCFGLMFEGENKKFAVSEYSLIIDNCRNGKSKITLEEFINYYDKTEANFLVKDQITVNSNYPKKCYSTINLALDNQSKSNYLIEFEDNSKEILTKIHRIWRIDLTQQKFIEVVMPKNFKCYNPEYADGI